MKPVRDALAANEQDMKVPSTSRPNTFPCIQLVVSLVFLVMPKHCGFSLFLHLFNLPLMLHVSDWRKAYIYFYRTHAKC